VAYASETFLSRANASETFLSRANASETFLSRANASETFLSRANASDMSLSCMDIQLHFLKIFILKIVSKALARLARISCLIYHLLSRNGINIFA